MKLHFDSNLDYQIDAINAVVDVFQGQPYGDGSSEALDIDEKQMSIEQVSARGNVLLLPNRQIVDNVHAIQNKNRLDKSPMLMQDIDEVEKTSNYHIAYQDNTAYRLYPDILAFGLNFSIEMETGTGKT